jgi:RNA-directed DNA polymerase
MTRSLDPYRIYYGKSEREIWDMDKVQPELISDKVCQLRLKLYQKAKNEPKFRFYTLYDRVCRMDVLEAAWKQVARPGKAAGIDGVRAEMIIEQEQGVEEFLGKIQDELKQKCYCPSAVKRVYIPKADGKKRPLGIPTLRDKVVQMAVLLLIEPIFEADFLNCSYGFRPKRGAHGALREIRQHIKEGKVSVYDADLKGYFDSIPHDKLIACVRMRIVDRSVLRLIKLWLKSPVVEQDDQGKRQSPRKTIKGTPQGGVISPLLANVYLHWFDKMFHRADGPFYWANARLIRYADDFVILARWQGHRLKQWVTDTIEGWQGLEINREKTSVVELNSGSPTELDFLGFTFRYDKDLRGGAFKYLNLFPSKKSLHKARSMIREKTGPKRCYMPTPELVVDINLYLQGWSHYFRLGYPRKVFRDLNHYVRSRMITHLNRRSQRKYHKSPGTTHYRYLEDLGLLRL